MQGEETCLLTWPWPGNLRGVTLMMLLWALDVSTLPLILDMGFMTKSPVGSSLPSLYPFLNSMFTCGALGCRTLVTTLVCMREWNPGNLPWCYKSVCVWMYRGHAYVCAYTWRSEDDVECPPQSFPTLFFFETESNNEPGIYQLFILAGQCLPRILCLLC